MFTLRIWNLCDILPIIIIAVKFEMINNIMFFLNGINVLEDSIQRFFSELCYSELNYTIGVLNYVFNIIFK